MKISWKAVFAPILCLSCGCGATMGAPTSGPAGHAAIVGSSAQSSQHPQLASQLVAHLRTKYPNLESHLVKAVCSLDSKYPGLVYSLPRHLIEDLDGEPAQALRDVAEAETQQYPNLLSRVRELRQQGPRKAAAEYVAATYPGLRSQFLDSVDNGPSLKSQISLDARSVVQSQYPQLPHQIAQTVSHEADADFPGMALDMAKNRGDERPLRWLMKNHPEFVRAAVGQVMTQEGTQIRAAAVTILARLEQDPAASPAPRALKALDFVTANFPTLLAEVVDQRMAVRQKMRAAIQSEFPQLGSIAITTLAMKHPQLISKAMQSLQSHYPNLRTDAETALESELPGIRQETRTWLTANYPDVAAKLPPL